MLVPPQALKIVDVVPAPKEPNDYNFGPNFAAGTPDRLRRQAWQSLQRLQKLMQQVDVHAGPQLWAAIDRELEVLGRLLEALAAVDTMDTGGQGETDGYLD